MKMGGFVGKAEYNGAVREFVPLLKLGESLHVGKATGVGLGKYRVVLQSAAGQLSEGVGHGSKYL